MFAFINPSHCVPWRSSDLLLLGSLVIFVPTLGTGVPDLLKDRGGWPLVALRRNTMHTMQAASTMMTPKKKKKKSKSFW